MNTVVFVFLLSVEKGSVQAGYILGGPRFRGTAIRFFKFVWYFQQQVLQFFLKKQLELKTAKGWTKAEEEGTRFPFFLSLRPPLTLGGL